MADPAGPSGRRSSEPEGELQAAPSVGASETPISQSAMCIPSAVVPEGELQAAPSVGASEPSLCLHAAALQRQ